ncbi:hypothetical protein E1281_07480 [Actinomadura sp. KC345]|uniref:hypothetical protein n=1 Tax=Actinomadura sp. KC345 TaxID=2530371 RepID=UPI0010503FCB|nr:hypothetical protein [Actinomadura sp. KC345]TDC56419.1 hypothetical protein E1281_07480 [Actinomadura sp. KC345]
MEEQLDALTRQWNARQITNDLFFKLVPGLEQTITRLRGEKNKHEAAIAAKAAQRDTSASEVRRRWYLPEEEGGFPISVKRTYIRSALHAATRSSTPTYWTRSGEPTDWSGARLGK